MRQFSPPRSSVTYLQKNKREREREGEMSVCVCVCERERGIEAEGVPNGVERGV